MKIKDALPGRKVKIEIHFVDASGKSIKEPAFIPEDQGHNKKNIATVTDTEKIREIMHTPGKLPARSEAPLFNMEYLAVIPLAKRYIFYVRERT